MAKDAAAFAGAYGATIPIAGEFPGKVQSNGDTIELQKPGATTNDWVTISAVRYENNAPWPIIAPGSGVSLQLIDAAQDARRAGNWTISPSDPLSTPGAANNVAATLPDFTTVWINEVEPENLNGLRDSTAQPKPWIELYNAGTSSVALDGFYLATNYSDMAQWAVPAGTTINPGEFKVIFADGQEVLSSVAELHTSFQLPASAGSVVLARWDNGKPLIIDYINYSALTPNESYGSFPDGQPLTRQAFIIATPGAANIASAPQFTQVTLSGSQLTVGWGTFTGHTYRVEYSNELNPAVWTPLAQDFKATGESLSVNVNILDSPHRFLRIVQLD